MTSITTLGLLNQTILTNMSLWTIMSEATWMVKGVLILLLAASIISVGIIIRKQRLLAAALRRSRAFNEEFARANDLEIFYRYAKGYKPCPSREIFLAAYEEWISLKGRGFNPGDPAQTGIIDSCINRALRKTSADVIAGLEKNLTFLASCGSTAPFVGLFGTVWGIMNSFFNIGVTGASSLAVVAPGISEALIATAVGLFAAIPAVIFYNLFNRRIKLIAVLINHVATDFLTLLKLSSERH